MRAPAESAVFLFFVCLVSASLCAGAQQARSNAPYRDSSLRQDVSNFRPLSLDEGLAILGTALDSRRYRGFTADCSHFVHELYQRAGFPYAYASSSDLYSGVDQFKRVNTPQTGDLIVWRGHVGIVISPVQHSFFSLLRSGAGVGRYDSPYWRRRGHPRFLRYLRGSAGTAPATSLSAGLNPINGEDDSGEPSDDDVLSNRAENVPSASGGTEARFAGPRAGNAVIPPVVVVNSAHLSPEQVRAAFLQSSMNFEQSIDGRDIFQSAQCVVVFDHFVVRKLHTSGAKGWAEVEISELVSVVSGKTNAGESEARDSAERQRWPLIRRNHATWELTPPRSTIYLPQDIAAHLTAQRLAQLTRDGESSGNRIQKTELARLLNVLLQK
jgi:NlpC/P60 family